jgi:hypothetical protein
MHSDIVLTYISFCFHSKTACDKNRNMEGSDKLPAAADLMKLRQDKHGAYTFFAEHIINCVSGKKNWKQKQFETSMREGSTATDEAFAILLLENGRDKWEAMARSENGKSTEPTKYTRTKKEGGTRKYEGWSDEGLERFNELLGLVQSDRRHHADWDAMNLDSKRKKQKRDYDIMRERTAPHVPLRAKADNQLSLLCDDDAFSVDTYDDESQLERAEI